MSNQPPKSRFQAILDAEHARRQAQTPDLSQPPPSIQDPDAPPPPRFEPTDWDRRIAEQQHKGVVEAMRKRAFPDEAPAPQRVHYSPPNLVVPRVPAPLAPVSWWARFWRWLKRAA